MTVPVFLFYFLSQLSIVHQVSIVGHGNSIRDISQYRLSFFNAESTHCRIACMTNANFSLKPYHVVFIKNITNKPRPFFYMEPFIVGHDSCSILTSVLEMNQTVI